MKWLLIALAFFVSACASTSKDEDNYIRVTGSGASKKEAKEAAFQNAIEISVGTLVLSDQTAVNNRLVRKELNSHSSGFISDFRIISEDNVNDNYTITMDVLVHTSKIHERLLSVSKADQTLNGEKLYEQYRSFRESKESSVNIVNQVLDDFPKKAFNVTNPKISCGNNKHGTYCFKLDKYGNAIIEVPFTVSWNYNFLKALGESLSYASDPGSRGEKFTIISKSPNSFMGSTVHYNFNDVHRIKSIKMRFLGTVYLHANVIDAHGKVLFNSCTNVYSVPHIDYKGFLIRGTEQIHDRLLIKIDKSTKINNAHGVELKISKARC